MNSSPVGSPDRIESPLQLHRVLDPLIAADAALTTLRLSGQLSAWAQRLGPPLNPKLSQMCCACAAYVAPWLSLSGLYAAAQTLLWIFAIDTYTDGPEHGPDVRDEIARLHAVAHGGGGTDEDVLTQALGEIRDSVAGLRWGAVLESRWQRAADDNLTGSLFEFEAAQDVSRGLPAPALPDYLMQASGSIALSLVAIALWADMPDPGLPDLLEVLDPVLADASLALRLSNDLRGHAREQAEGTLDALTLGMSPDDLARMRDTALDRAHSALRPLIERGCATAIALERLIVWCVRHYQRIDPGHEPSQVA